MNIILSQNGLVIPKKEAEDVFGNDMKKFINKLTITTRVKVGPPKIARMYKYEWVEGTIIRNGKQIALKHQVLHIPRGYLGNMLAAGIVKSVDNILPPGKVLTQTAVEFAAELENNQKIVADNLMQNVFNEANVRSGRAMCTLNLGAGRGKTFIAANIISKVARAALYYIPNSSILSQTLEAMNICFPNANIQFFGDIKEQADKAAKKATKGCEGANIVLERHKQLMQILKDVDICIIIINSAMMMNESFFSHFGLMIFDEVHEYCGKKRSEVFWKCQAPYMLGMSATTDEHIYNWDKIYYMQVGEVIHANKMPGYDPAEVEFIGSVKIIKYHGAPGFTENKISEATGYLFTPDMHLQAMNDTCRNMLIICEILLLYLDTTCERNIFVFFERREHVQLIVTMMNNNDIMKLACDILSRAPYNMPAVDLPAGLAYAPELEEQHDAISMMRGGSKQEEINKAMQSRIIVTTYGYSKTGVSITKMNSLIIGTSRKSKFKQTLARAMRLRSDYSIERKFIDIVDWDTAIKAQHYERRKAFVFYELTMSSIDISWELFKGVLDIQSFA